MVRLTIGIPALFAAALLLSALCAPAHAYIDWGSWSYAYQLLIAGALGGLFALKVYWAKIKAFFLARFGRRKDDGQQDGQ